LGPGRWIIELGDDEEQTHYALVVPEGTQGLFKAGVLTPMAVQ
jgi:hypothetical protein